MALLKNKETLTTVEKAQAEAMSYVPALGFVYLATKVENASKNLGKFVYNKSEILNYEALTVTLIDYRGWVYSISKDGLEEQTWISSENEPNIYDSPKANLIRQKAKIDGHTCENGADILVYIHEVDKFAVLTFKQTDSSTFKTLLTMDGSVRLNKKTIVGKKNTYYRFDPIETGEPCFDYESHELWEAIKSSYKVK